MNPDPSRRRVGLVLAAGAFASVATSYVVEEWTLARELPITGALDTLQRTSLHAISAELEGAFPIAGLYGYVEVQIEVATAPTGTASSAVTLTLRGAGGDLDTETVALPPNARTTVTLGAGAFAACRTGPCVEAWELEVERLPVVDSPGVTLAGTATVTATGTDDDRDMLPPPGTTLFVDVTDLGPPS